MPRARTVTMGKLTAAESHDAAIRQSIKKHKPYEVVGSDLVGLGGGQHAVVFTAP